MLQFTRRSFLASAMAPALAGCQSSSGMLSGKSPRYQVRDPQAGYFDLATRRRVLQTTRNPVLLKAKERMMRAPTCSQVKHITIQDQPITLPSFYGDNVAWRAAVKPFWDIENAVSRLAGANVVAQDRRHADCLMSTLMDWARRDALAEFNYSATMKQGWFQVEATLFSIAAALSAIRADVRTRVEELAYIDAWLGRIATQHFAISGSENGTCCNNHFYRRALYAALIGVMIGDDRLFNDGVGAIGKALADATPEGALPLEMTRGAQAAHYQNFAVMYLVMIAEIAERQGYPIWTMQVDGKSLHTLVAFNNRILADPRAVIAFSKTANVNLRYLEQQQYFAWFEIYLSRFSNPQMEQWIAQRRPMYNRGLGGYLTAYFYADR